MKKLILYYDYQKTNKVKIEDLAIYIYQNLPLFIAEWGSDNVAIYMDIDTKTALKDIGIESDCIKTSFQPLDNQTHTMRWLSIMAMQTESFQIIPIDKKAIKRGGDALEVGQLQKIENNPVLSKYGIEQTGGLCGGDILAIPDASITRDAYCDARDIIQEHEITDESEIANIMGSMLYKSAIDKNIEIIKTIQK